MIMQNNGPMAPPLPYLPSMSTSTTFPSIHSADAAAFHIPNMRRVLSSPTKDLSRPRGPSDPYTGSRQPRYTSNDHAHEYMDDYLPSFLRDQQSTNTKQAIKQMAEHRVLLETHKLSTPLELAEEDDDEYTWYLQNPHRYIRRPRDRSARKQRRKMVLYGEMVDERDDETNRKLFAAYLVRHYGVTLYWNKEDGPTGSRRRAAQRASTPYSRATAESQAYWNDDDASDADGSTVFCVDDWEVSSSPTLGDASSRRPKLSCVSSIDNPDSLSSDFPSIKAMSSTTHDAQNDDSKRRWFSNSPHASEGKRTSFFRTNSTRMRSGSHRRFSFLRIFST